MKTKQNGQCNLAGDAFKAVPLPSRRGREHGRIEAAGLDVILLWEQ